MHSEKVIYRTARTISTDERALKINYKKLLSNFIYCLATGSNGTFCMLLKR